MSQPESNGTGSDSSESVNGSWVKLGESMKNSRSVTTSPKFSDEDEVKDLLADAVEDHFKSQRVSKGIPKVDEKSAVRGSQSISENVADSQNVPSEWVMNWSSRPEVAPKKKWVARQPSGQKRNRMSLRRTKVMKSGVDLLKINLRILIPALVLSHSILFGIGFYVGHHVMAQKSD